MEVGSAVLAFFDVPNPDKCDIWRTVCNGWCTSRGFHEKPLYDLFEHYVLCKCTGEMARRQVRLEVAAVEAGAWVAGLARLWLEGVALHFDASLMAMAHNRLRDSAGGDAVRSDVGRLQELAQRSASMGCGCRLAMVCARPRR